MPVTPYRRTFTGVPGIPEPYELVRLGRPEPGEEYMKDGKVYVAYLGDVIEGDSIPIVYNPQGWRQATYTLAESMPHTARFRDKYNEPWIYGTVSKYSQQSVYKWFDSVSGNWFKRCEIYVPGVV